MLHIPLVVAVTWSFIILRKGHPGVGILENSSSQKLSFPSSSQRKEVLLKYTGTTKGATSPERG